MSTQPAADLLKHFGHLADPRIERTKEHKLVDIVIIAICAIIAGADGWVSQNLWSRQKEMVANFSGTAEWHACASHDTFGRVFGLLDPTEFEQAFSQWVTSVSKTIPGQIIALDGKSLRRSHDHLLGKDAIHMVSA